MLNLLDVLNDKSACKLCSVLNLFDLNDEVRQQVLSESLNRAWEVNEAVGPSKQFKNDHFSNCKDLSPGMKQFWSG